MSDQHHNTHDGADGGDLTPATLMRCAADGELSPRQQTALAELLARSPGDEKRIAFERELRLRVGAAMGAGAGAPGDVVDAVRQILAGESESFTIAHGAAPWRQRYGWIGAAAVVGLALVVALQPTSPFSPWRQPQTFTLAPESRASLVSFVEDQHGDCARLQSHFRRKMTVSTLGEAESEVARIVGVRPSSLSLERAGYELVGAGRCAVPGRGESVHLIYSADGADPDHLSLFIQRDTGHLEIEPGRCFSAPLQSASEGRLHIWRAEGLIYYLIGPGEAPARVVRALLNAPADEVHVL